MALNKELMLKVADAIEQNPKHFDMDHYIAGAPDDRLEGIEALKSLACGTTGCIAGWAAALGPKVTKRWVIVYDDYPDEPYIEWNDLGRNRLGLTEEQADDLFFPGSEFWVDQAEQNRRRKDVPAIMGANALTPKTIAKILRKIVSGEVKL